MKKFFSIIWNVNKVFSLIIEALFLSGIYILKSGKVSLDEAKLTTEEMLKL